MNDSNLKPYKSNIISVIGISMGDEGKGRVVHEVMDEVYRVHGQHVECVMKVNGGANAGHTAAGLKLNLLPSGVGNPEVKNLLIGAGVVADPRKFLWEAKPLEHIGISVLDRLAIDEKCQVSDVTHRILDLAWENYRVNQLGEPKRGSTGRGISPAYSDETSQWQIFYSVFKKDRKIFSKKLREKISRAEDTIKYVCKVSEENWFEFFQILSEAEKKANIDSLEKKIFEEKEFLFSTFQTNEPFRFNADQIEEAYWHAGQQLCDCIIDGRNLLLSTLDENKKIVAEFGQAFWLDKRHGFTPNVTASHTFGGEFFLSGGIPLQEIDQVGCCKAYDTKVGTHHFITKIDHTTDPIGSKLAKLEFGTSTGRQRMVGWFDAVEKGIALRYGGFDQLVINKLDALTLPSDGNQKLKICTAYQLSNGKIIKDVPEDEERRNEIKPIYEEFEGWHKDLQNLKSFLDFPEQAKRYIFRMITSIIEIAFPNGWRQHPLPNIKFVGVGPDPRQIVGDIPSTINILEQRDHTIL